MYPAFIILMMFGAMANLYDVLFHKERMERMNHPVYPIIARITSLINAMLFLLALIYVRLMFEE